MSDHSWQLCNTRKQTLMQFCNYRDTIIDFYVEAICMGAAILKTTIECVSCKSPMKYLQQYIFKIKSWVESLKIDFINLRPLVSIPPNKDNNCNKRFQRQKIYSYSLPTFRSNRFFLLSKMSWNHPPHKLGKMIVFQL